MEIAVEHKNLLDEIKTREKSINDCYIRLRSSLMAVDALKEKTVEIKENTPFREGVNPFREGVNPFREGVNPFREGYATFREGGTSEDNQAFQKLMSKKYIAINGYYKVYIQNGKYILLYGRRNANLRIIDTFDELVREITGTIRSKL